ncbi:uncharacterized protein LOC110856854 [Folsomia candida]|nr:uncharacterized protein LOC110856854 [Folsomia candida]
MRSICVALFLFIGCSQALQLRSPVYSAKNGGGSTPAKQAELPLASPAMPAPQQAQAREGTVPVTGDAAAVNTSPNNAQNYMVYYYPEYRAGQTPATAVPYDSSPSVFSRIPWVDVGYVVVSLGLIIAGGTVVYNGVGSQVKTRAMRELAGIDFDDASNVARRVLRAIEKFQNMNVETQ